MSENVPSINPATIKIKKNYGITHALKDLVDEMIKNKTAELTDGKITAKEWNAVLDKLIELQNNRKAEGKASIFGGGTDKTKAGWHNSFIVHPDQQIEFTAEETAQLYEAMGVVIKNAPATQPPPVNENPEVKGSEKPEEKPKAEEKPANPAQNPPAAGTPQERLAANPYVKATEPPEGITAKQGKDANNDDCEIWTDQNGREVKRIYNKGDAENEYCVVIEYDNNGKKTAELETKTGSDSDKLDFERRYDEQGRLAKYTNYKNDGTTVDHTYTYKYNEDNSYTQTRTRGDNSLCFIEEKDSKDRTTKYTKYQGDGKTVDYTDTYTYDDKDGSKTQTRTRGDGTLYFIEEKDSKDRTTKSTVYHNDGKTVNYTDTYTYNDDGSKTKTQTRGDGTVSNIEERDSKNRITKVTYYKENGKTVNSTFTYKYNDKDGSKTITHTRGDGTVYYIREQDSKDRTTKSTYYKEDGKTVNSTFTYTYNDKDGSKTITHTRGDGTVYYIREQDKDGNVTKQTKYKEDGKTVDWLVENGVLRLTHIKSKNSDGIERDYKYEFDENGKCTKSVLASSLHHQISGPSLNSNTIALLEYINPENVIKVLTSYEAVAGQSLVQALKEEWFMGEEPIKKYIEANLEKRLEQLGIKDETIDFSNPEFVKKLAKLDNEKTK